ncbi:hypothetical protein T35B1_06300 [Salinisphaera shabanensis T35B1]|uniref:hypothetical protein n=1 Tax=Salinisphaera shabanensis TaxID=180542 RepID=UPI00333FAAF4
MLKLLETLKDSAESTFDSAASRVENVHRLISGYVGGQTRRLRGKDKQTRVEADRAPPSARAGEDTNIYDVIRGVNREIGEFGTDVFEIIDDARARREIDKNDPPKGPDHKS